MLGGGSLEARPEHKSPGEEVSFIYFILFVFLPFLGPLPQHMEVPRLGV